MYITFQIVIFVLRKTNDMNNTTTNLVNDLIEILKQQVEKGVTSVTINGTILSPQDGNGVLVTTEPQM